MATWRRGRQWLKIWTFQEWHNWLFLRHRYAISPAAFLPIACRLADGEGFSKRFDHRNRVSARDGPWLRRCYTIWPVLETGLAIVCFFIANFVFSFIREHLLNLIPTCLRVVNIPL
jgi:hypothetical protein